MAFLAHGLLWFEMGAHQTCLLLTGRQQTVTEDQNRLLSQEIVTFCYLHGQSRGVLGRERRSWHSCFCLCPHSQTLSTMWGSGRGRMLGWGGLIGNEAKVESGHEIKNCLCPTEQGPDRGFNGSKALGKYLTPLKPIYPTVLMEQNSLCSKGVMTQWCDVWRIKQYLTPGL